jgi:hypothetical protein
MKNPFNHLFLLASCCFLCSCVQRELESSQKEPLQIASEHRAIAAADTWETVVDGSFNNSTAFEAAWNYLYPWGPDHNGSARMYKSNISLSGGVLTLRATRITANEGNSASPPHLPIRYHSGAVHAKTIVLVNDSFPNWEVRGEFQAPTMNGAWPAFWLNGVNTWPPESDILEFMAGDTVNWQNTWRTQNDVSRTLTKIPTAGEWHRYGVWITKESATDVNIHYYIDGNWIAVHRANFVDKPLHVIINLQMEGSGGTPGPTADTYYRARNIYIGRTRTF